MKRKEIVMQRDITDCGPCCLLSIIIHYGGYVPLEKIRLDSYADNRGTSAYNLIRAANIYGFDAVGVKCDSLNDIKNYPCIAHVILENGYNHYMVISDIKNNTIILMDPAKGKTIMNKSDFLKIWDNIVINFYPKQKIIKYPVQKNILSFFYSLVLEDKSHYLLIIILSIIITLSNLILNFNLKISTYVLNNNLSFIFSLILLIVIVGIKNSLILFHSHNYIKLNCKVHKRLVSDFTTHIFSLPSNLLDNKTSGEIMTRVSELNHLKDLFSELIIGIILDGLLVINSGIVLFVLNRKLTLFVLMILIFYFLASYLSAKKVNRLLHNWIIKETNYNESLLDAIKMNSSIKNLQIKSQITNNLDYLLEDKISEDSLLKKYISKINLIKGLINDLGLLALNFYAIYQIYWHKMTMINYLTYNTIYIYLFNSFVNILSIMPEYYYLKNSIYKISEFKNLPKEIDKGFKSFNYDTIRITNLSYSYNNQEEILNNINICFLKGQDYFLNGVSGSGKSTLLKILYKEINDFRGTIYFGKVNYQDISLKSLRNNIIYVNQKESLFNGTIYQNIICFRDISENDFSAVCNICMLDDIVNKKPLRYFSNINDALSNLSGGEKQRIILARNLLKKGHILFVDEALSEVDKKTEIKIINNIKNYYKGKTIIYVSHKNLGYLFNNIVTIPE